MRTSRLPIIILIAVFSSLVPAQSRPVAIEVTGKGRYNASLVKSRVTESARRGAGKFHSAGVYAAERRAFDLMNAERRLKGIRPLAWSEDIAAVARLHSRNMAAEQFFSHRGRDGSMVNERAARLGIFEWNAIGENIAFLRGYQDPADLAVEKWMQSPSHRNNLLSTRWGESAIGAAVTPEGTYYFTQVFIAR